MIQVENLAKKFGSLRAVDGISFQVERGVLFGLLGPNGAGKTTTINVLSTLLPPDEGKVTIGGYEVRLDPAAVRRLIGIVPQEIALYQDLAARDNLLFWGRLYGLAGKDLGRRVDELLELADLHQQAKQKVETFSGGMKRRLNLVAGLVHSPEILYLDEPTVGIDAQARSRILEMIRELSNRGMTVIYTTHYLEEAEQLCDRIGVIDKGRMVALGDKEQLIDQVGDQDIIRLHLPQDAHKEFMEDFAESTDCLGVRIFRGKIEVCTVDGARMLPGIQAWLSSRNLDLQQLEVERPNLETLYLNLTGRDLRE
ncbi:MAG: ATP-binding cassette domain-containing protein [Gemmatimonadales bacterium]|nr:ATP-binding cassette domain-containing protein [Gemmatimonadales bacterium]